MADAPWQCSQCGTVNEPVANACRTCGRWPSLFDLERSTIPAGREAITYDEADEYAAQTVDVEVSEPEIYDAEPEAYDTDTDYEVPPEFEPVDEDAERSKPLWQRLSSLIIPIGVVVYIIISALANNDAG